MPFILVIAYYLLSIIILKSTSYYKYTYISKLKKLLIPLILLYIKAFIINNL